MDVLPLGLIGDGALRAAVVADREVTRMEGARLDHLAQYLGEMREAWMPPPVRERGAELLLRLGGVGTPEVAEFTVCEVAGALGLSQPAATGLCADVLDLAYRLRAIAGCVRSGVLPFTRARLIARRTRDLGVQECAVVEATLTRLRETGRGPMPVASLVPIGRLRTMVDQAVIAVRGPESEEEAEAAVAASLFVDVVHEAGGATDLAARLSTADAARLDRRLDEIAGWLSQVGDTRSRSILRAVALGLLADPDLLATLAELRETRAGPADVIAEAAATEGSAGADRPSDVAPGYSPSPHGERRSPAPAPPTAPGAAAAQPTLGAAGIAGLPTGVLDKLARLRSTVLYVHLDRASGTWCEENAGVLTKEQARQIVGHSGVTVRPVLDLAEPLTYTGYEAPLRLKEQLALLNAGYCTFPHCSRRARPSDVDHQQTHGTGGPTASRNTHRLCRKHHRAKDKGRWRVASPAPGFWIWRSPAGAVWLVANGTTTLLNGILAGTTADATEPPGSDGPSVRAPDRPGRLSSALPPDEGDVTYSFIDTG